MTRHTALAKRFFFPSIPARLGLVLALLTGIMGIFPASPAQANDQISTLMQTDAVLPIAVDEQFVTISAGLYHTCGLKPDGSLACWGYDGYGQVSGPNGSSDTFAQVSAGGNHTCGVKTDGSLACWGNDSYEQVSGPNASSETFTQVSAGGSHTCGLKGNGRLDCWGYDVYGQVSGPSLSSDTFSQVAGGSYHTCGVKTNGALCRGPTALPTPLPRSAWAGTTPVA
ncbi:MAG: RCC1 domain-containing protein [Planctomycetota bacterium]